MKISKDVFCVGVNDRDIDLFEGQYKVNNGMAYNSYVIVDEKIAVMDSVGDGFAEEWLRNIAAVIGERKPDYLVVQHMEPDHSANVLNFVKAYPNAKLVSTDKSFVMLKNFFGTDFADKKVVVGDGDTLCLGKHTLTFVTAPMVHWPEVIMTYDDTDRIFFSADAFGSFGINDDGASETSWADEARRYYIGIVGKFGVQVQSVFKKIGGFDIATVCPLHGSVLRENLGYYLNLYQIWSTYATESQGILLAYTSVYGHTKEAVERLASALREKGCEKIVVTDLARCDMAQAVADAFRYGKLVLATTTYNGDIFPYMRTFIEHLVERRYQKRTVAFIENGTWAPQATKIMKGLFEGSKEITFAAASVKLISSLNADSIAQIEELATELREG